MLRKVYNGVLGLAGGRYALPALAGMAFIDGSLCPMPPDILLGPMALARPERARLYAGVTTIASILGGCLGFAIGFYIRPLGQALLAMTGHAGALASFQAWFARFGLAVILIKGFIPIPYQIVSIASGLAKFSFPVFVSGSLATRGLRFFGEAYLLRHPRAKAFIDQHLIAVSAVAVVVILLVLLVVKRLG